jgi:hypothetical protein
MEWADEAVFSRDDCFCNIGSTVEYNQLRWGGEHQIDPISSPLDSTNVNREGWLSPFPPIPFSKDLGMKLWLRTQQHVFGENLRPSCIFDDLKDVSEPERSGLHSFWVDIVAYQYAVPESSRPVSVIWLIENSLTKGPSFAKRYDSLRDLILEVFMDKELIQREPNPFDSWREKVPKNGIEVGFIYKPDFLFTWHPPDLDLKDVISDPVIQDSEALKLFRRVLREYLQDPRFIFFEEDPWELFESTSGRKCIEGPQWTVNNKKPATKRGVSHLCNIYRGVKEERAAVIEEYSSLLRIKWINANVDKILSLDSRHSLRVSDSTLWNQINTAMHFKKPKWASKRSFVPEERTSFCRDFKKEGLTKPRNLLRIMLEELHVRFPKAKCFEAVNFFDFWHLKIQKNGEWVSPDYPVERGHGLGMANNLTTLMQIVIENINTKMGAPKPTWSGYVNDDAALVFKTRNDAIQYAEYDYRLCTDLGLSYKRKASFISTTSCVLCEQYASNRNRFINTKTAYWYQAFYNLLKACNVAHARELARSANLRGIPRHMQELVFTYWGWVLYRGEQFQPINCGGWWRQTRQNVDISFWEKKDSQNLTFQQASAWWTERSLKPQDMLKGFRARKDNKLYDHYPTEYLMLKGIDKVITGRDRFRPLERVLQHKNMWKQYLHAARKTFREDASLHERYKASWLTLYKEAAEAAPERDILPPFGFHTWLPVREVSYTTDVEFSHPYTSQPMHQESLMWKTTKRNEYCVEARQGGKLSLRNSQIGKQPGERFYDSGSRSLYLREAAWGSRRAFPELWRFFTIPQITKDWHNPFDVHYVMETFGWSFRSIKPKEPVASKTILMEKRKNYYSGELTAEEWMLIGSVRPIDQLLIADLSPFWRQSEDLLGELVAYCRRCPGLGRFWVPCSNTPCFQKGQGWKLTAWRKAWQLHASLLKHGEERQALVDSVPGDSTEFWFLGESEALAREEQLTGLEYSEEYLTRPSGVTWADENDPDNVWDAATFSEEDLLGEGDAITWDIPEEEFNESDEVLIDHDQFLNNELELEFWS